MSLEELESESILKGGSLEKFKATNQHTKDLPLPGLESADLLMNSILVKDSNNNVIL